MKHRISSHVNTKKPAFSAHKSPDPASTTASVWVKGTDVLFDIINPHSGIYLDQTMTDGQVQRWAMDGPGAVQLIRMATANGLKARRTDRGLRLYLKINGSVSEG